MKAMQQDEDAFEQLYKLFYKRVYFISYQYFKNEEIAKDIVQDVFIQVYKQIATLKAPEAFHSWLHTITYRMCQNNFRGNKKLLYQFETSEEIETLPNVIEQDVMADLEYERIKALVMESLDKMSADMKEVAILRFFEELKTQEIADILGVSKGTVSGRILRIKKKLTTDLKKQGIHTYSMVLLTPTLLHEVYQTMFDACSVHKDVMAKGMQVIIRGSAVTVGKKGIAVYAKGIGIGSVVTIALIAVLIFNQKPKVMAYSNVNTVKTDIVFPKQAEIEDVLYEQGWTNQGVTINVQTSNDNYDEITINDASTTTIDQNGTYVIRIIKDAKVLDEREIVISNIDKERPTLTYEASDTTYTLKVQDDASKVDWSSIVYYKNGKRSSAYTIDSKGIIILANDYNYATHELQISDNAGNVLAIQIK